MSDKSRATILGPDHIKRAIGDDNFFTLMPEFSTIRKKIQAMHENVGTGCEPCRKRRVSGSVTSDFVSILNTLSDDGLQRLKRYVGAGRLLVRAVDKSSGRMVLREI
jgi:hypothetical protein